MFFSENIALIIFGVIIILSLIIAWYMGDYANYDKGSFHTFMAVLAGLGVFITFLFYYNVILLQGQQQKLTAIQEISRINDSVLNSMLDEIKLASDIVPNFVISITPLTNTVCSASAPEDPVNPQTCTEKMVLSYRIFSLWQDVIISNRSFKYEPISYVSNFLQRANSPQLYQEWKVNRLNFLSDTQNFGDLLFEYGLPITDQTSSIYISTAENLIRDPRYIDIFAN